MKKRNQIKRILGIVITLLALAGILVIGWALYGRSADGQADSRLAVAAFYDGEDGATHILENDFLKMTMSADTTLFSVINKEDGHIWQAVPEDAGTDPLALAGMKNLLRSTLSITYSTTNGVRTLYDNYEYSIKNKIFRIEADENQIRVDYTLGRIDREYFIPAVIPVEKMDGFLSQLTKAQSRKVLDSYRKHDPEKIKENQKEELFAQYPQLEDGAIYVIRDNVKDFLKLEFEELLESVGYTYEDFLEDRSPTDKAVGDKAAVFNVSVLYTLQGQDLVVQVPLDSIRYSGDFTPIRLNILPNFGAGGPQDTGYMIMPEGGGSIINFNNGKIAQNGYFANVYGWDYATYRSAVVHETNARFPMFAMVNEGSSFLCLLEGQASVASIAAEVAGKGNSYNTASASYALLHYDAFNVTNRTIETIYMYEAKLPEGAITQRYRFIAGSNYVDLAKEYRDYLVSRYPGLQAKSESSLPLSVEIIGAIDKIQQKGGLPVSAPVKLTSYSEAADIVRDLTADSKAQAYVRLIGWMNGGIRQKILNRIKLVPQLGNQQDFERMADSITKSGARLYLGGIASFALDSSVLDGFFSLRDAARMTTREEVKLYQYSSIWYGILDFEDAYYLLTPRSTLDKMDKLAESAKAYKAFGVAYEDIGNLLSADYNPRNLQPREDVMKMQSIALKKTVDAGQGLMLRGGNLYALEHADLVTDIDLQGVNYLVLDENIPFMQIALHGLVSYTGRPLNLTDDWEQELLLSVQRGAGLSFSFMREEPLALHDTAYAEYFGASYGLWSGRAKGIIKDYEAAMDGLHNQFIDGYELLPNGVSLTIYEDGSIIAVNFSDQEQTAGGRVIPPRSYVRINEGVRE